MSTVKHSQTNVVNNKGNGDRVDAANHDKNKVVNASKARKLPKPERKRSYAEVASRKGSGQPQRPSAGRQDSGPTPTPSRQGSMSIAVLGKVPDVVREPEPIQHTKQSLNRGPSLASNSDRANERRARYFNDPFDLHSSPITVLRSEGQSFAMGFAAKAQSLGSLGHEQRDVPDTSSLKDVDTVKAFRSTLYQAVIFLSEQSALAGSLCNYTYMRKTPGAGKRGPKVFTLKGAQPDANVPPLQRVHVGPFTIDRRLSDERYADLNTLLRKLNDVLGTEYALERPGLKACLQGYVDESCDFGHIYGFLRPWWGRGNFDRISALLRERKAEDTLLRKNAVDGDCIINPDIPPRRVWDLFSNRVLPFYALPTTSPSVIPPNVWAVSHSWKQPEERGGVLTRINNRAWCVPLPRNADLHDIRNELLNLGAEYVFLDILCLRQYDWEKPGKEFRRKKEWRLDVPTIGYVYKHPRITVIYFNGLGEELKLQPKDGFMSKYHWFRRVWTLQEATEYWLPGGLTQSSFHAVQDRTAPWDLRAQFSEYLQDTLKSTTNISEVAMFTVLDAMRTREFANPVDAVAGLAYLLRCKTLPIYNADSADTEGAWEALIQSMHPLQRLLLLVCWGRAGGIQESKLDRNVSGLYRWRPTWEEVHNYDGFLSDLDLLSSDRSFQANLNEDEYLSFLPDAGHQEDSDAYFHYAYVLDACLIKIRINEISSRPQSFISTSGRTAMSHSPSSSNVTEDDYASESTAKNPSIFSSRAATPYNVSVEVFRSGRTHTFKVEGFIEPFQIEDIFADMAFPADDEVHSHYGDKTRWSMKDDQERECVLVGVSNCKYWIVGIKKGSRRIDGVKRVPRLYKVAVITLGRDRNGHTPDEENLGHVDMVAYC